MAASFPLVESVTVSAYEVPTDQPESDGTIEWDATTVVVAEVSGGGHTGLGYTYGSAGVAAMVDGILCPVVQGLPVMDIPAAASAMGAAVRNAGRPGAGMMAVSAVDVALWDLKGRLLGVPVAGLAGRAAEGVPVYGSGGFTSYALERIGEQLGTWVEEGIGRVKMKVSRHPDEDPARLDAARKAIGDTTELFVDANGALDRKQALWWAERFRGEWDVRWFEEPVSSDDVAGLRLLRDRGPAGMDVAAGEYAFLPSDFRTLLEAGAVDCLQADVTRCGGITGMLRVGALCEAHCLDLSAHGAPALAVHALVPVPRARHLEYFHDHVRVESLLFDGVPRPDGGVLRPPAAPGLGIELKRADAEGFRVR